MKLISTTPRTDDPSHLGADCHEPYATTPLKAAIQCVRAKLPRYAGSNVTDFRNCPRPANELPLCEKHSVTRLIYCTRSRCKLIRSDKRSPFDTVTFGLRCFCSADTTLSCASHIG